MLPLTEIAPLILHSVWKDTACPACPKSREIGQVRFSATRALIATLPNIDEIFHTSILLAFLCSIHLNSIMAPSSIGGSCSFVAWIPGYDWMTRSASGRPLWQVLPWSYKMQSTYKFCQIWQHTIMVQLRIHLRRVCRFIQCLSWYFDKKGIQALQMELLKFQGHKHKEHSFQVQASWLTANIEGRLHIV